MSATPITTMGPLSIPKVPKLRSSCEECGNAKVRCDRGQPECHRCVALGLTCVYGISRKFGKRPRKRPRAHLDITESFPYKRHAKNCESHTAMEFEKFPGLNKTAQLSAVDSVIDILPAPSLGNPLSSICRQNHIRSPLITPFSIEEWPQLDFWEPGLEFSSISNGPNLECQLPAPAIEPANPLSTSYDSPDSHSCPRGSYELFRDLICPGPFLHAPESNSDTVLAELDQVLLFNRDAIDRLNRLLKCPCAKSGHRIMVNASIVSRILIWYQQAAGWSTSNSGGVPTSPSTASSPSGGASSSSPPSATAPDNDAANSLILAQPTGFAVAQVPVSMGSFSIEDHNLQAAIRNQLVLSELKKAENLIDHFVSQDCGEASDQGVTNLYSHLGVWLRNEHSKTVRILRLDLAC
jgi:hypothetical protein